MLHNQQCIALKQMKRTAIKSWYLHIMWNTVKCTRHIAYKTKSYSTINRLPHWGRDPVCDRQQREETLRWKASETTVMHTCAQRGRGPWSDQTDLVTAPTSPSASHKSTCLSYHSFTSKINYLSTNISIKWVANAHKSTCAIAVPAFTPLNLTSIVLSSAKWCQVVEIAVLHEERAN